jgi:multidrug efflux pump subunit AcrA (membrane-fusion protein)
VSEEDFGSIISATGIVVPRQWVTLSFPTSGVVEEVLVSQDEMVEKDQALARLQGNETLSAAISAANLELTAAQEALDSLYEDPELRIAQAKQAIVNAQQDLDDAEQRLENLNTSSDPDDIEQARANAILAKDKLDKAEEDYAPYEKKPEDNVVRAVLLSKAAQARKEYEAAQRLVNNLLGTANALDLEEARANLALAEAQLVTAERNYEALQSGPDPDDVALAEKRVENARVQLESTQAALDELALLAPFAGTVSDLNLRASEWVVPGQPAMTLADLGDLRVETTDLSEIDVARLKVGDPVIVTFDALPGVEVQGRITRIASKSTAGAGVNYTVVVELDEVPEALRWGMTAFVDIPVEE